MCQVEFRQGGSVGNDGVVPAPENDISHSEALGPASLFGGRVSVFSHAQEVVKGHTNEVIDGLLFDIRMGEAVEDEVVGNCHRHSQFGLGGRVLSPVALYLPLEGWPVDLVRLMDERGAGFSSQLEGRADGCQRLLNSLSANLIFSSRVSIANPRGKGLDEGKLLRGVVGWEEWLADAKHLLEED